MYASSSRWKSDADSTRQRVLRDHAADEVEERGLAEPVLDHAEDLRPAVVGAGEQADEVPELRQLLRRGAHLAVADRAVHAAVAVVLAMDVRQPLSPFGHSRNALFLPCFWSSSRWVKYVATPSSMNVSA